MRRSNTPNRQRSGSTDGSVEDDRSVGSTGSMGRMNGSKSPGLSDVGSNLSSASNPGTPRGFVGSYYGGYNGTSADTPQSEEWIEISRDQLYIPGQEDIGRKLKLEAASYSTETGELLMHRVVKTDLVLARAPDPPKRPVVTAKPGPTGGGARFRIASYNVLAEIYATQQQYPYCDIWALSWDYRYVNVPFKPVHGCKAIFCSILPSSFLRFQNILREIVDASPDVVCLQEIQADHYENHFYAAMSDQGYEGVYKQKTRQSMGLAGKVDGCALFWRRTKFHLAESYSIEFNELAQRQATQVLGLNPRTDEGIAFMNRLNKDNVAQLVVLELAQPTLATRTNRDPINQICIANTHFYSNKDFPDVKLWQAWQLLQELENFVMSRGTNLPLIICGDFNSTPDTAVYDLFSRQAVHPGHPDVNVATGDDVPNVLPDAMNITHSFQLGSAYQTVLGDEPITTNYTANFKGVLDYVWYSVQNLRPLSAAPVPDESVLTRHGEALPSTEYSSDHIMLISDMQIMSGGSRPP